MLGMKATDMACASAIWMGAYTKEISRLSGERYGKKGIDPQNAWHDQAVKFSDNAVRKVNPDFDASSRCQWLRDKGIMSIFNMFSSNSALFAQRRRYHHLAWEKGKLSTGGYARYHMYDFVLQGAACGLAFALLQTAGGDDEDRAAQYGKSVLANIFDTYSMALPLFGPMISKAIVEDGRQGGVRTLFDEPARLTPGAAAAAKKGVMSGFEEKDLRNMGWATLSLAAMLAKTPLDKVARKGMRGYDQWQDEQGGPGLMLMPK
jgi:hypothetical protein